MQRSQVQGQWPQAMHCHNTYPSSGGMMVPPALAGVRCTGRHPLRFLPLPPPKCPPPLLQPCDPPRCANPKPRVHESSQVSSYTAGGEERTPGYIACHPAPGQPSDSRLSGSGHQLFRSLTPGSSPPALTALCAHLLVLCTAGGREQRHNRHPFPPENLLPNESF